ncbi:ATP-binding cassette domain-containing protein, partial [Mesorhizobium sp. M7A.F.Ca.US.014.04.1.1]
KETTSLELARMMVGSKLPEMHVSPPTPSEKPVLEVNNLSVKARDHFGVDLKDVSFNVHGGEIVGLAGVSGNGQAELIALLSGERTHHNNDAIRICGTAAARLRADERRKLGLAFVPEERLGRGAVPSHTLWENAVLTAHRFGTVRNGLVDRRKASAFAAGIIDRFKVKANGPASTAQSL